MTGLAEMVLETTPWAQLRTGGRPGDELAADVRLLLFGPVGRSQEAYARLENEIVSQHDLYECAPAVVRVIAAALVEESILPSNLGMVLDQFARIFSGVSARDEVAVGCIDLRERCHAEAQRAYWGLIRLAAGSDAYLSMDGAQGVEALDEDQAERLASGLAAGLVRPRIDGSRGTQEPFRAV